MKFGKSKTPTKPGWYWYAPINGNLKPKAVVRTVRGRLGCHGPGFVSVETMIGFWGDEIPTPKVELEASHD